MAESKETDNKITGNAVAKRKKRQISVYGYIKYHGVLLRCFYTP